MLVHSHTAYKIHVKFVYKNWSFVCPCLIIVPPRYPPPLSSSLPSRCHRSRPSAVTGPLFPLGPCRARTAAMLQTASVAVSAPDISQRARRTRVGADDRPTMEALRAGPALGQLWPGRWAHLFRLSAPLCVQVLFIRGCM